MSQLQLDLPYTASTVVGSDNTGGFEISFINTKDGSVRAYSPNVPYFQVAMSEDIEIEQGGERSLFFRIGGDHAYVGDSSVGFSYDSELRTPTVSFTRSAIRYEYFVNSDLPRGVIIVRDSALVTRGAVWLFAGSRYVLSLPPKPLITGISHD